MQFSEVTDALRGFIMRAFNVGEEDREFSDDVHLFDYGYIDSFGAVQLIGFIEERFGVKISDTDLVVHPLNTIREIGTLVHSRLGA